MARNKKDNKNNKNKNNKNKNNKNKNKNKNPNKGKKPKNPNKGGTPGGGKDKKDDKPGTKSPNTTYFNIFAETPEIDEVNADSVAELVDNFNKNLQSRYGELVARYSIKEVDKLPKNFARYEKYNDEDRDIEFDDIVSYESPEDENTRIPRMIAEADFEAEYKFGHSTTEGFIEDVPLFLEDGSVEWHLQLSIPDTIGISDYIIEIAEEA